MLKSLFSGVAGLKTHQTKMDVIGNNIANVNTYAFKSSRVSFKDVFYQTLTGTSDATIDAGGANASQIGYGSMVGTIDVLHNRAAFSPTNNPMDVFIEGEGFLIARDGKGNETYTRVGMLGFDGGGNLIDGNRKFICGYPIKRNVNGDIVYKEATPAGGKVSLGKNEDAIRIDFGADNGAFFNKYSISIKTGITDGATPPELITDSVQEINIDEKKITLSFGAAPTREQIQEALRTMVVPAGGITPLPGTDIVDIAKITVNSAGTNVGIVNFPDGSVGRIEDGVNKQSGIPELDMSKGPQQIKKPGTLFDSNGDGSYDSEDKDFIGELTSISIGPNGIITGATGEGTIIPVGQICLASVPNPAALVMEGSSYFKEVNNTGKISYIAAGEKTVGKLTAGGLEMSNVDLSNEFADMIITQRGFQANSKIITVSDEMLQELVNMKR